MQKNNRLKIHLKNKSRNSIYKFKEIIFKKDPNKLQT